MIRQPRFAGRRVRQMANQLLLGTPAGRQKLS
jgi:hypothetical protein